MDVLPILWTSFRQHPQFSNCISCTLSPSETVYDPLVYCCCFYRLALNFCATLFLTVAAGAAVALYMFYALPEPCTESRFFVLINASLCLLVCFISVFPCIKRGKGFFMPFHYTIQYNCYWFWSQGSEMHICACNRTLMALSSYAQWRTCSMSLCSDLPAEWSLKPMHSVLQVCPTDYYVRHCLIEVSLIV